MTTTAQGAFKARYEELAGPQREPYLKRARECAAVTIPRLVPNKGDNHTTDYGQPWQAIGARCVNMLAAKMALVVFPPSGTGASFFRTTVDEITLEKVTKQEGLRAEIEEGLSRYDRAINLKLEAAGIRAPITEAMKYLLVAGNVVLSMLPDVGGLKMYRLDRFVLKRSPDGKPIELIVHETISASELPPEAAALIVAAGVDTGTKNPTDDNIDVYTRARWQGGMCVTEQEIAGVLMPGKVTEPAEYCRWIILAPMLIPGEDYARAYVDEYMGDLMTAEGLSKAITQASAIMAKILLLVSPNAAADIDEINKAESGDAVAGREGDVTLLQLQKAVDLQFVKAQLDTIERRLGFAFLLNSSIQRNGERVTAEEIRFMAQEIESALGGIYTALGEGLQRPLVLKTKHEMEKNQQLPPLPKGVTKLVITTGADALGRNMDLQKLDMFLVDTQKVGPEAQAMYLIVGDYLKRRAAALGLDAKGLVRSEEEVQQMRAQMQQAQLAQQVAPIAADAALNQGA